MNRSAAAATLGASVIALALAGCAPSGQMAPVTTTTGATATTAGGDADLSAPAAFGPSGDPAAAPPPGAETVTVASITDGDTLEVGFPAGGAATVRLIGINTPESGECLSGAATMALSVLVPVGGEIGMTTDVSDSDRFGRLLRYLWRGGMSVNEEMVRRGAAISRPYPPDTAMKAGLDDAEAEARAAGRGLWAPDACGPATRSGILIAGIDPNPPGDDNLDLDGERVRVENRGVLAVDMTGWVLKDESSSHRYRFPDRFSLSEGATVEIRTGCGTDTSLTLYWCSDGAVWNNSGGTAFLLDPAGNLVDALEYD